MNFHDTVMGQRFFQKQLPELTEALNRVAKASERANEISELGIKAETKESYGYKKFKDILAAHISVDGIRTFVQNSDDEIISENLDDVMRELLATEGCCPHCGYAVMYSDVEDFDFVCTYCDHYIRLENVAPFKKSKTSEIDSKKKSTSIPGTRVRLGDDVCVKLPWHPVNCSDKTFFDLIEYDCFELIKKYAELFGLELCNTDGTKLEDTDISFDLAKEVQEVIINMYLRSGVELKFSNN